MTGRVLVGVDGSEGSRQAMAWALEEAALRHSVLEVVIVWEEPSDFERRHHRTDEDARAGAQQCLAEILGGAGGEHVPADIEPIVLEGDPADTLCLRADKADVLVVGSRGHSTVAGVLLGSVSSKCAHHSRAPVVIVPPRHGRELDRDGEETVRIVVGVDGSVGSRLALKWAVDEAALRGARVEAVAIWRAIEANDEMNVELAMFPSLRRRDRSLAETTKERLEEVISELARESAPVDIDPLVFEGSPAEVLCERAAGSELLVVGSRGHGAVAGLLLGSVSAECAHRSPRPVVIVPTNRVASSAMPQAGT